MINAYAETYINDAMKNLGEAFDYAINVCHLEMDEFMSLFIATRYAEMFERGNPKIISGLSGTELAIEVLQKGKKDFHFVEPQTEYDYSIEYWCGWVLAYYQWTTNMSFKYIHNNISMTEVRKLYPTLHEASENKFVDVVNAIIARKNNPSRLQSLRKICGYTQLLLAKKASVNLRTLQQYESKAKNINKASLETILSLANVLGCKVEDLVEYSLDNK